MKTTLVLYRLSIANIKHSCFGCQVPKPKSAYSWNYKTKVSDGFAPKNQIPEFVLTFRFLNFFERHDLYY
jgi:hypothetical protein